MGNRQDELAWWKEQKDADGYETTSLSIAPGTSTAAFWVAQQLLAGAQDVPHDIVVPYLRWDQDNFEAALAEMEPGDVGTKEYTLEEMQAAIEANNRSDPTGLVRADRSDDPISGRVASTSPSRSLCGAVPPIVRARR